jgi:Transposase and inactivated derivatives
MLGVSRSSFYKGTCQTEDEKREDEAAVVSSFQRNKGRYGRIRIRKDLLLKGIDISEYRISNILRKNGLEAKNGRTGKAKKQKPAQMKYVEENLIKNKFSVKQPNYLWCSDITELRCRGTKLYLCGIIDVATRRIVGWSIAKTQTQKLVQDAFVMAVGRNPDRPVCAVFHSDRGCQYTARRTKELLESNGFRRSMSRPGTPSDNQPIESFWRTLECEMPDIRDLPFKDAGRSIVRYIELYYNSERLHSGIQYLVPDQLFTLLSVHYS